ncbi:endonuclease 8-like 1 [Hyperolius riggenbachi]|uniref:endonuclease 8-like 1 n=1 Tax=Hyperolius riggenbachi TaxID=752182 RepID=UPI0035A2ECA1
MPEGPELHLSSLFVNKVCAGRLFAGKVEKSEVNKNPEVPFSCPKYTISAVSRGKEIKLILTPVSAKDKAAHIVVRFGMSGSMKFTAEDEIPKHAHLRFYTKDVPRHVLSFVDPRRFGSWDYNGSWQPERGPCVMTEYEKFRENVLKNLSDKAFDKPICEAMLNQKFFKGIGNYLRAEILFRLQIPPFMQARAVLEALKNQNQNSDLSLSKKIKIKKENPDILQLCHLVPLEVIELGSTVYDYDKSEDYTGFVNWLQCYFVPGMKTMKDSNGRTIWFQGDPGPLAPKGSKSKVKQKRKSADVDNKQPKIEKTTTKRKAGRASSAAVKKEKIEEIETEPVEKTTKKRRGVTAKKVKVDKKIKTEGELVKQTPGRRKTVQEPSSQGSAVKTPAKRGRAKLQVAEDVATPKSRARKPKPELSHPPRNSPKPRQIKSVRKTAPSNSPKVNTKLRRKSAVPNSEDKS